MPTFGHEQQALKVLCSQAHTFANQQQHRCPSPCVEGGGEKRAYVCSV
uniref:Uncharacterized protein n=1 Tax=Setaria viridis TaxID=4556 RepID=A0A4V6Y8L9_SETVI|nr:hypothetical protein SEVIR_3G067050v2 [Setaria viridis]